MNNTHKKSSVDDWGIQRNVYLIQGRMTWQSQHRKEIIIEMEKSWIPQYYICRGPSCDDYNFPGVRAEMLGNRTGKATIENSKKQAATNL